MREAAASFSPRGSPRARASGRPPPASRLCASAAVSSSTEQRKPSWSVVPYVRVRVERGRVSEIVEQAVVEGPEQPVRVHGASVLSGGMTLWPRSGRSFRCSSASSTRTPAPLVLSRRRGAGGHAQAPCTGDGRGPRGLALLQGDAQPRRGAPRGLRGHARPPATRARLRSRIMDRRGEHRARRASSSGRGDEVLTTDEEQPACSPLAARPGGRRVEGRVVPFAEIAGEVGRGRARRLLARLVGDRA